jgi:ATP-GRASP peptide maturase of grasp-with-spasm system
MILVISDADDLSTNDVLKWLLYYKVKFFRINTQDLILSLKINISNNGSYFELETEFGKVNSNDVTFFYYRRGFLKLNKTEKIFKNIQIDKKCSVFLKYDLNDITEIVDNILIGNNIPHYGNMLKYRVNKLLVLNTANKIGIRIPTSLVVNKSSEIIGNQSILISKGISDNISGDLYDNKLSFGTNTLAKIPKSLPNKFFPTLFQEKIEKLLEIRVFFFNNIYYGMAIFSQLNPKTKDDFRNYDKDKPNRNIPFKLPSEFENKLKSLMEIIGLNTGSIDLLFDNKSEDFIFLEVNPVGQYGALSYKCNYFIEREIAKYIYYESSKKR